MTGPLHLRDGIGFCRFDACAIVLDVAADRYWQLDERLGQALVDIARGAGDAISSDTVERLIDMGFVTGDVPTRDWTAPSPPTRSAFDTPVDPERFSVVTAIEVVATTLWTTLALRRRGLRHMLDKVAFRRPPRRTAAPGDLPALSRRFARYRRWLPLRPVCLPDSLAYLRFLARRGHYPDLIFGVEAHPFAAHCWVQDGDVVLNDVLDHATLFTPIHRI